MEKIFDLRLKRFFFDTVMKLAKQKKNQKNLKTLRPLFMDGVQLPQGYSHFEEVVYFLPQSSQKLLVLILPTSEGWKAKLTLEPSISGFEHGTSGFEIQRLNHQATAPTWCECNFSKAGKMMFHYNADSKIKRTSVCWLNHTSTWVFSCKFAPYFRTPFPKNNSGGLLLLVCDELY